MTNEEFDRFAAETVMRWEKMACFMCHKRPDGVMMWWNEGASGGGVGEAWHPSTDLNDMRLVEMAVIEKVGAGEYGAALLQQGGRDSLAQFATLSVEQRKQAILSIKELIEEEAGSQNGNI